MSLCTLSSLVSYNHGSRWIRRLCTIWKNNVNLLIRFKLGFEHTLWHVSWSWFRFFFSLLRNLECGVKTHPVSTDTLNPLALKLFHILVGGTPTGPNLRSPSSPVDSAPRRPHTGRKRGPGTITGLHCILSFHSGPFNFLSL